MIGIDNVSIVKFIRVLESEYRNKIIYRIFSENEGRQFEEKALLVRARLLPGRYAVKDASIKASAGKLGLADLKSIETKTDANGVLCVVVSKQDDNNEDSYSVSLSHDGDYAVGVAIKLT